MKKKNKLIYYQRIPRARPIPVYRVPSFTAAAPYREFVGWRFYNYVTGSWEEPPNE